MKPIGKRVLVQVEVKKAAETKTASGLILTAAAQDQPLTLKGKVLAIGNTVSEVEVKDTAVFMPYVGVKVGEGLFILTEDEILATE